MNLPARQTRQNNFDLNFSKVPPQAVELEKDILGILMLEKSGFERVAEVLKPEMFYTDFHQKVFTAIRSCAAQNKPIDFHTVAFQMIKDGVEFIPADLTRLTNQVTGGAHLEAWAEMLVEKYVRRELIRMGGEGIQMGYDEEQDVKDAMQEFDKEWTRLNSLGVTDNTMSIGDAVVSTLKKLAVLRQSESHITGIPSGLNVIDRMTHGWQPGDFIILAARPSMGKTALALQFARTASKNPFKRIPVGFFSLEMSTDQLTRRLLSSESEVGLKHFMNGRISDGEQSFIDSAASVLSNTNLYIDDTGGLGIMEFRTRARRMKRKHGVEMIILDYLQLMEDKNKQKGTNREQEVSAISRGIKGVAKELGIPIIALAQLSREVEKRPNKEPIPSDLRESGSLEQDADLIMFLYRPEYYGITADENGQDTQGMTQVKIAKHRNGETGSVWIRSNLSIQCFEDMENNLSFMSPQTAQTFNFSKDDTNDTF